MAFRSLVIATLPSSVISEENTTRATFAIRAAHLQIVTITKIFHGLGELKRYDDVQQCSILNEPEKGVRGIAILLV
jgi:hypothetical protein